MAIGTPVLLGTKSERTAGTTCVITVGTAVPVGDEVVVGCGCTVSGNTPTVTDSRGNTYAVSVNSNGAGNSVAALAASVLTTALQVGDTITVTWATTVPAATTGNKSAAAIAFTGNDPVPLDKTSAGNNGNTVNWTSGATAATTQADEIAVGVSFNNAVGDETSTPGAGYTEIADFTTGFGDGMSLTMTYKILAATGAQTASGTWNGSGGEDVKAAVATYKATAAAAPAPPASRLQALLMNLRPFAPFGIPILSNPPSTPPAADVTGSGDVDLYVDGSGTAALDAGAGTADLYIDTGGAPAIGIPAATADLYIDAAGTAAIAAAGTLDLYIDAGAPGAALAAAAGVDLYVDAAGSPALDAGAGTAELYIDAGAAPAALQAAAGADLYIDAAGTAALNAGAATIDLYIDAGAPGAALAAAAAVDLYIDAAGDSEVAGGDVTASGTAELYVDAAGSADIATPGGTADLYIDAGGAPAIATTGGADLYLDGSGSAAVAAVATNDLYVDAGGTAVAPDIVAEGTVDLVLEAIGEPILSGAGVVVIAGEDRGGRRGTLPPFVRELPPLDELELELPAPIEREGTVNLDLAAEGDGYVYGMSEEDEIGDLLALLAR